jgi:membrane protein implicated in regulation of membrane protease activity
MIFRPDRSRRGADPAIGYKMLIFVVGAVAGIAGIALEMDWLIIIALLVLLCGLVLRFAARRREDPPAD